MGETKIVMPEGEYPATYDLVDGWWEIEIRGGIPAPGKAEDAHNVGIDGTYWVSFAQDGRAPTIGHACREIAESIVAERDGWTLPFPMSVGQAVKLHRWTADYTASNHQSSGQEKLS